MLSIKVPIQKRKHIKVKSFDIQKTQVQEKIVARPEEEFHFCLTKRRRATSIFTSCCEYGKAYDLLYYSRLGQHHPRQPRHQQDFKQKDVQKLQVYYQSNLAVRSGKKSPGQDPGLENRGRLKVLNNTKLVLNDPLNHL